MILSASREFDRTRNPLIIERPSDNVDLPKVRSSSYSGFVLIFN